MISVEIKNTFSEVFELMKLVDRNDLKKVPLDILNLIKRNRNKDYTPKIEFENINKTLSKEALALYIWLYKTYMIENKYEVQAINRILYNNEIDNQKNYKYNLFNKKCDTKEVKKEEKLIVYKESFISKILNKLREIFKIGGSK